MKAAPAMAVAWHWPRIPRWPLVVALLWCAAVLLAHMAGASLACGFDTSGCVQTRDKAFVYRGSLPVRNTQFQVAFPSVELAGEGLVGGFRTDSRGRYCIVWGGEDGTFVINGSQGYGYMGGNATPLHGHPPAGCQYGNKGIPWDLARDLRTSWQYISVIVLGLATIVLLVAGLAKKNQPLRAGGLLLSVATTVLPLVVWWGQL